MSTRLVALAVVGAALIAAVAVHGAPKKDEPFKRGALGRRAYRLYVPLKASIEPRTLVVALHGCWQTPEDFARGTRLNDAGTGSIRPTNLARRAKPRSWRHWSRRWRASRGPRPAARSRSDSRLADSWP